MPDTIIRTSSSKVAGFKHTEITIASCHIPSCLNNYHMVQLSDLHFGIYTSPEIVNTSVEICNSLNPDLVLLTGDYVHVGRQEVRTMMYKVLGPSISRYSQYRRLARNAIQGLADVVSKLTPREKIIGIWGNHDYLEGKRTLKRYLPEDIQWLENQTIDHETRGHVIRISGIDDYRFGEPDIKKTIDTNISLSEPSVPPVFRLFLSHNPDSILLPGKDLLNSYDLMLCGHTHGGQICLPGSIPLRTQTKQKKVLKGLKLLDSLPVYVSNGIGCSGLPLRLFCPPEIVSVRLTSE
jgi:uncharacterized protein